LFLDKMSFYDHYVRTLETQYPQTAKAVSVRKLLSQTLVCPDIIKLPKIIRDEAQAAVDAFYELRLSEKYQAFVATKMVAQAEHLFFAGNYSALMCFDFHWTHQEKLKLIEINTNASVGLIGDLVYKAHGVRHNYCADFRKEILETFKEEFSAVRPGQQLKSVAIVDQKPEEQRLFIEFLLYKEMFEAEGMSCAICDSKELTWSASGKELYSKDAKVLNLVYNRDTDFYLDSAPAIKNAWLARAAAISPNPNEYALLADKQRLEDLAETADLGAAFGISSQSASTIQKTILKTTSVNALGDKAWDNRKYWFFKPKRSYGGKAVYRGASVSRNVFEKQILPNDYLAQEFAPPSNVTLDHNGKEEEYKYDLRFFAYKNKVQLAVARVYQGQTTNAQTPGGGIAAVTWI
jgi:hypothetical protein